MCALRARATERTPNVARAPSCHYFPGGRISAENKFAAPDGGGKRADILKVERYRLQF